MNSCSNFVLNLTFFIGMLPEIAHIMTYIHFVQSPQQLLFSFEWERACEHGKLVHIIKLYTYIPIINKQFALYNDIMTRIENTTTKYLMEIKVKFS